MQWTTIDLERKDEVDGPDVLVQEPQREASKPSAYFGPSSTTEERNQPSSEYLNPRLSSEGTEVKPTHAEDGKTTPAEGFTYLTEWGFGAVRKADYYRGRYWQRSADRNRVYKAFEEIYASWGRFKDLGSPCPSVAGSEFETAEQMLNPGSSSTGNGENLKVPVTPDRIPASGAFFNEHTGCWWVPGKGIFHNWLKRAWGVC